MIEMQLTFDKIFHHQEFQDASSLWVVTFSKTDKPNEKTWSTHCTSFTPAKSFFNESIIRGKLSSRIKAINIKNIRELLEQGESIFKNKSNQSWEYKGINLEEYGRGDDVGNLPKPQTKVLSSALLKKSPFSNPGAVKHPWLVFSSNLSRMLQALSSPEPQFLPLGK